MLKVVEHSGARAFLGCAEAWLLEHEDLNNLILGLARSTAEGADEESDVLFATVEDRGRVVGCVLRTPPHKVLVTDLPDGSAGPVADMLARRYTSIPAVLGPKGPATAVAEAWILLKGGSWSTGMRQRMYRLDSVRPPSAVEGRLRSAGPEDEELAVEWAEGFSRDARIDFPTPRATVHRWIAGGDLFVWEVDGSPRSIAVAGGRTPHGVRVGYVYTPPEYRRSGYASALVAKLSQRLLDDGYHFCVLYTDLSNPTSNAIYARVGYEPLCDVVDIEVAAQGD